ASLSFAPIVTYPSISLSPVWPGKLQNHPEQSKNNSANGLCGRRMQTADKIGNSPPAILDEAAALGDAIVEQPRGRIALMRQPVDALGTEFIGAGINRFDQGATGAAAAHVMRDEQVLQIKVRSARPGRTMQHVVHDADEATLLFGDKTEHRFDRVEQPRESKLAHLG